MKAGILLLLLFILSPDVNGQWYHKKFNVSDINLLSQEQLDTTLREFKTDTWISVGVAGLGGLLYLTFRYVKPGMSEDPGLIEQLLGDEGVNKVGEVVSLGITGAGIIAVIVYLTRVERIRSVINNNYPVLQSMKMSPVILVNNSSRHFSPGISLTWRF